MKSDRSRLIVPSRGLVRRNAQSVQVVTGGEMAEQKKSASLMMYPKGSLDKEMCPFLNGLYFIPRVRGKE